MPSAHLTFKEEEVIKLALEFLSNRELSISQLSLERETGVINGTFSDDLLFLRQLILDGQWDDVLEFIQPLESIEAFDSKQVRYVIVKHKYIELLCIRSEAGPLQNIEVAVEEVVQCLNELEQYCPSKEDYNNLCLLLTLPRLSDHLDYKNWNPSNARAKCFKAVLPLIERFLQADKKTTESLKTAKGDRLIQLIIKGILYESCVEYCQHRATASLSTSYEMHFAEVMNGTGFSDSDLSLLSWLQCIPPETFSYPFEQKTLTVDVEQLEKPSLEASWSEQILVTPIKPKIFPHSATPFNRMRAADLMSRSLTPGMDVTHGGKNMMAFSMVDLSAMSRSFAGFHLTGKKAMITSVDRLFEEGDVFSTSVTDLRSAMDAVSVPGKGTPNTDSKTTTEKTGIRDKLDNGVQPHNEDSVNQNNNKQSQHQKSENENSEKETLGENISNTELWREFQRLKSQICASVEDSYQKQEENEQMLRTNQLRTPNRSLQQGSQLVRSSQFSSPTCTSTPQIIRNGSFDSQNRQPSNPNLSPVMSGGRQDTPPLTGPPSTGSTVFVHVAGATPPSFGQTYSSYGSYPPSVADSLAHSTAHPGSKNAGPEGSGDGRKSKFVAVTRLEDPQAIRAAEFHPNGQLYAIGSNSKTLRICSYPKITDLREDHCAHQPTVLFKRLKHHKGSIYCLAWNATGDLLATGSNDKSIKLMRFNADTCNVEGGTNGEAELTMHDGTVRDMCFMEDLSNRSSLLISGGAGDCKIYVTDCETATPFQSLTGHSGHILSLYTWGGAMFVSGSQDRTIRFWDLRTRGCVNLVTAPPASGSGPGSPVAAVSVDPSGRLLVSGHDDSTCMLYDIRGSRSIQCFRPHSSDIRTIRFSPKAFYLLTGSYDHKVILTDLQGDLTQPLPSVVVAEHTDKVIQGRWHPRDFSFLSTSADRTATLWALPPN